MSETRRLAAIDIGTVTTRLLVADVSADTVTEVERSTDITHLGEGLTQTGVLAEAAMARVDAVIARYTETIAALGVERTRCIATSASRDAANGEAFRAMLAARGIEPEIVAGATEADLAFLGATAERTGSGLLVVDCGGGSTELVLGSVAIDQGVRVADIAAARSIDVGSRRMTELFFHDDPPTRAQLDAAREWATEQFRPYFDGLRERPRTMLGLAGTATSLVAIQLEMEEYDAARVHGFELSGSQLSELLDYLASLSVEQRKRVAGLHPGRAGVIVAGALIFETLLALAGVGSMIVSEHDILYGILIDTYRAQQEPGE